MDINIKSLDIPRIRKDGRAVELVLMSDTDDEFTLTIPTSECDKIIPQIPQIMRALTAAKVTRTLHPESEETFKTTPALYHASDVEFITQPNHDIAYLAIPTLQETELHICFQWPQIRKLIAHAQKWDGLIESPDNTLPS